MIRQVTEINMLEYLTREVLRNEEIWGKGSIDALKARQRKEKYLMEMRNGKERK